MATVTGLIICLKEGKVSESPDTDTLRRAVSGDSDAFAILADEYAGRLYGVCFSILGNHADAQDCVQESLLKAFRMIKNFQFASSFYTWLYRIATNNCYDLLRRNQRHAARSLDEPIESAEGEYFCQLPDERPLPDVVLERKETIQSVREELLRLPEQLQRMIMLRDIEELSYAEIAELEHLREGTVKSRLFRARIQLAERLQAREHIRGKRV
jgi:RNA polymerase sigma factor (sigma-70 family)